MKRLQKIAALEAQLEALGRFVVLAIDRDDVRDRANGVSRLRVHELDAIAADAAADLANNDMDNVGITEALQHAAEEHRA